MVTSTTSEPAIKLTLEQFLHQEKTKPASEYWDGEVVRKAMPTGEHGSIQRLLSVVFTLFLREHPIADCGPEIRCNFRSPERAYSPVPDFIVVRTERLPRGRLRGHVEGAPDIAVEILSPDDLMSRVMRKIRFYLANGVTIVWLVNPYDRTVMV
jgi:Uma2 family endonuclease